MEVIDDTMYSNLAVHVAPKQMIEICFTAGTSNMINRFHATFLTELDPATQEALAPSCPLHYPELTAGRNPPSVGEVAE